MKMIQDQVFGFSPNFYMQYRPQLARFPFIFNVTGDCTVGNSSGYSSEAILGGLGEYIERYHFYHEVDSVGKKILAHDNVITDKLTHLINQVKITQQSVNQHAFHLTAVRNIFTDQPDCVPKVMISLADADLVDRKFIPFIDSCGQAVHVNQQAAFDAALKEFIERQALVGAWLSGKAKYQINLDAHPALRGVNPIITTLKNHGELLVFDISNELPGYSTIVFYFSNDDQDNVRYSVGAACDFSPERALSRAIHELWQSYTFIYLNADNPENLDQRYQYLNDLIHFNCASTRDLIPFFANKPHIISHDSYLHLNAFSREETTEGLRVISNDVLAYERSAVHSGKQFYFCKIMSPDFFLHMGIKQPINFDNHYAGLLAIEKNMTVINSIPFP